MFNKKPRVYADVEFDIEGMKAYAIERLDRHTTLIAHMVAGKALEWGFECSPEKHQELVDRVKALKGLSR